ncbi:MAG: hypothetical protein HN904_19165 [Victivallales bacterium]|jgi:hypothetical protein|nr:hypothetical protein [Victivallales bacterium]
MAQPQRSHVCSAFLGVALLSVAHAGLFERLTIETSGSFGLGETRFHIQHFSPGWACVTQSQLTASRLTQHRTKTSQLVEGTFPTAGAEVFQFRQEISRVDDRTVRYSAQFSHGKGIPTKQLALGIFLPVDLFVGVPLQLGDREWVGPEEPFKDTVLGEDLPSLVLPTPAGRLVFSGPVSIQIQDGRTFADKRHFRFRIYFSPRTGTVRQAKLAFGMRLEPYDEAHPKPQFGKEYPLVAGEDWQPLTHHVYTTPDSILDWSGMNRDPAGAHGPVIVRDGHFVLAGKPDEPLRFFGTNICDQANYQDKPGTDRLAAQLARLGHNTARLHHYDRHLVRKGKALAEGWDAAALDQLDYLFAALKRRGLYITIDLYTLRLVTAAEIDEVDHDVRLNEFKALVALSPSARANWREFSRRLLTHVNPYTGLAWKDDPALFSICLLNENNVPVVWNTSPATTKLYRERFAEWLQKQGRKAPASGMESSQPWAEFLIKTHQEMYRDCAAFIRSLGTKALFTDANNRANLPLALIRQELDYADSHAYFDHRKFLGQKWRLPYAFAQISPLATDQAVPHGVLSSRHFGLPFAVTEFNYVYPNHYRAVGGPLFGAYAALQDWDGIYRYAYSHQPKRIHQAESIFYLDNVGDPLNLLADRIALLLFRRRDVASASGALPFAYDERVLTVKHPLDRKAGRLSPDYCRAGFHTRIGLARPDSPMVQPARSRAVVTKLPLPKSDHWIADGDAVLQGLVDRGVLPAAQVDPAGHRYQSETGQLLLDTQRHRFAITTPRTECLVLQEDGTISGSAVQAEITGGLGVVCVAAMDGRAIAQSRRLLVFHLTDVQNTGVTFRNPEHTILTAWGTLPHLVRRGTARLRITFAEDLPTQVHELALDGSRRGSWPSQQAGSVLSMDARTVTPAGTRLLYEITRGE